MDQEAAIRAGVTILHAARHLEDYYLTFMEDELGCIKELAAITAPYCYSRNDFERELFDYYNNVLRTDQEHRIFSRVMETGSFLPPSWVAR